MEYKLLTQQDIAGRWQLTVRAVENCRKAGIITAVKGVPGIRFNLQQIEELEGTKLERFSPIERKKLEREIEALKQKIATYEDVRAIILSASTKMINL
ncbi:histidine kinase [Clostridium estertheticum subsp. estertheticum]|uniref:Histidine kinase n=1 Tax=Clostridium estertheticum subsp. estertheticum TaxID=1552 RepID=A0A1J0GMU7_9CLOT|nr:histidine kinase [Clostridium estertheticum subsp. estertheticum]